MFDEIDCPAEWNITSDNAVEFLEALYIHEWLSSDELIQIIKEHGFNEGGKKQINEDNE